MVLEDTCIIIPTQPKPNDIIKLSKLFKIKKNIETKNDAIGFLIDVIRLYPYVLRFEVVNLTLINGVWKGAVYIFIYDLDEYDMPVRTEQIWNIQFCENGLITQLSYDVLKKKLRSIYKYEYDTPKWHYDKNMKSMREMQK